MKKNSFILSAVCLTFSMYGCKSNTSTEGTATEATSTEAVGQSGVKDDVSAKNAVQIAVGSKDHTTLVAAVKAADLVDVLSNSGPFTVFAPTNAAFDKLPAGTVDGLLKPEKKEDLRNILQYHVYVGGLTSDILQDGQVLNQANGDNITISKKDGKIMVNGTANVLAEIKASNGVVYVIDAVLLPPAK